MSLRPDEMASMAGLNGSAGRIWLVVWRPLNQTKMEFTNSSIGENSNVRLLCCWWV